MVRDKVKGWINEETPGIPRLSENFDTAKQKSLESITLESIANAFPKDLKGKLYFEDSGKYVIVKARKYLGSEVFKQVAEIIRDKLGGEYISAGRESHFRIRKE